MSRIADTFKTLESRGEKALILFVTAGDPPLDQLLDILAALTEGGADLIEIGLPFSDPIADGPSIQASSQRALDRGTKMSDVFEALGRFSGPPLVLMGYMNSILRVGLDEFADRAANAGIDGSIVCDLTPDEAQDWIGASHRHHLDNIFLAAPTSTDARLDQVCAKSTGFIYAVSRTGVTGTSDQTGSSARELVERLRSRTKLPVCVGFGIRSPGDVAAVSEYADGAIIGSSLVDFLNENWELGRGRDELVRLVKSLKAATRTTTN